jgi:hypothetical protein
MYTRYTQYTRAVAAAALLTLASRLDGQGIRLPRGGRTPVPQATPLPPEVPAVSRALAYKRSRWSGEVYPMVTAMQIPAVARGTGSYTTYGTGTRGDYRYTDRFSGTLDLTASFFGAAANTQTAEVGTRFHALPWNETLRPFLDVRAAYLRMSDQFVSPTVAGVGPGTLGQQYLAAERYSRGFGGVAGAGVEYSLTRSIALTTEVSTLRNRMTVYKLAGPATIPADGRNYWLTSFRYSLGLKFNPVRALQMVQNPR